MESAIWLHMYIFPSCSHHISIIFPKHPGAQLLRRPTSVPSSRVSFARARPWPFPSAGHSASGHRFGARKLLRVIFCHIYLVGGFNHLEQYESQWLVDYPIYYGNLKKNETTNQCAYYYIMFSICLPSHNGPSYKKSGGRLGVLILGCVSRVSLQLLPQRSHGSLSRTDGLPLLLIKLFLRGKVAGRNLVHGCLMMVQDPCITWPLWFVVSLQTIYSSHGRLSECFDDSLLGSDEELGAVLTPLGGQAA